LLHACDHLRGFKHSNTAEILLLHLQARVIGTYRHRSKAHLGRYCRELNLRYNART
jgi:hypothetical protein